MGKHRSIDYLAKYLIVELFSKGLEIKYGILMRLMNLVIIDQFMVFSRNTSMN